MNWVLHQFSRFTSTLLTVVASLPYPLLAVHLYDPESSLCTSVRRNWWKASLEKLIGTPSLVQVMFGWGSPEALHVSVKSFPASTCTLSIGALVILGGADNEGSKSKMNTHSYSLSKCTQEYQTREEYSSARVSREKGFWVRLADKGWCIIKLVKKQNLVGSQKIARKWRLDVSFFFLLCLLLKQPSFGFQGITDFVSYCQRWYSLQLIMGIRNYGVVVLVAPAFICSISPHSDFFLSVET